MLLHFLEAMQVELENIRMVLFNPANMMMTRDNRVAFNNATHCYILC